MDRLNGNNIVPLYEQLKIELNERIENKILEEGQKLPSEAELCKSYGVSRITVRRAVDELVEEGVLERRQGKGTFVACKRTPLAMMTVDGLGFSDRLHSRRKSIVISKKEYQATKHECEILHLDKDDTVYVFTRQIMLDGKPWMIDRCIYPAKRYHGFYEKVKDDVSTYQILREDYHVIMKRAHKEISLTFATNEQAKILECQPGTPLFKVYKIVYDEKDMPVHISTTYSNAQHVVFVLESHFNH